jgi:Chromo (CHRromatin Organisation MOdifier) domain
MSVSPRKKIRQQDRKALSKKTPACAATRQNKQSKTGQKTRLLIHMPTLSKGAKNSDLTKLPRPDEIAGGFLITYCSIRKHPSVIGRQFRRRSAFLAGKGVRSNFIRRKYSRKIQGGIQVLVKWMGLESAENSWEPVATLVEAPDLLREFLTTTSRVLAPEVLSLL